MNFVICGNEPPGNPLKALEQYGPDGNPVWDTSGSPGSALYQRLQRCFGRRCGYCGRPCIRKPRQPYSNEFDHFRPRSRWPELTFEWENLIYSCRQCNTLKSDQFPAGEADNSRLDQLKSELDQLAPHGAVYRRIEERIKETERSDSEIKDFEREFGRTFAHPSEADGYVNPRDQADKAKKFFVNDPDSGRILPNPNLDDRQWSKAVRTICDLDLNRVETGHGALASQRKGGPRMEEVVNQELARVRSDLGSRKRCFRECGASPS